MKTPSDKQIEFVDAIANRLEIDFPQSSHDFTARTYYQFINEHIQEFYLGADENYMDEFYDVCGNDVWTEHY